MRYSLLMVLASVAALCAPVAYADPAPDPHMPNMQVYCPGGGVGSQVWAAYCDGVPYPDGTFWHRSSTGCR